MSYQHDPEFEPIATALRRALSVPDVELTQFCANLMPSDAAATTEQVLVARDILGKLCEATLGGDEELWDQLGQAHEILYPSDEQPKRAPAAAAAPIATAPSEEKSPWAVEGASAELRTTVLGGAPQGDALPFKAGGSAPAPVADKLEPHADIGQTAPMAGDGVDLGPVLIGERELRLTEYAGATAELAHGKPAEEVFASLGIDDADTWARVDQEYEARFDATPELRSYFNMLLREQRSKLKK